MGHVLAGFPDNKTAIMRILEHRGSNFVCSVGRTNLYLVLKVNSLGSQSALESFERAKI